MTTKKNTFEQLLPLFSRTGVGIIILFIIWVVITNLPMIEGVPFPLEFSLEELLGAVVLVIIGVMLINFGTQLELRLTKIIPAFSQGGTMVKQLVLIMVVFIAYFALRPLTVPYLGDLDWVYHLIFLFIILNLIGILGYSLYTNINEFSEFLKGNKKVTGTVVTDFICNWCNNKNEIGSNFCSICGNDLPKSGKCNKCHALLKPGGRFCPKCGSVLEGEG